MPIMLAQPTPKPEMAKNNRFLFSMCGKARNPIAASSKQSMCTDLAPYFLAKFAKAKADKNVTILYHPFTKPVQDTAFSYSSGLSFGVAFQTDKAILLEEFCQ